MWTHQRISLKFLPLSLVLLLQCTQLGGCIDQALTSRTRQLSNIEPYLKDRARQSANQESLTSGGGGSTSSGSRGRQLAAGRSYGYVSATNYPTDHLIVAPTYHGNRYNNYPANRPAYQEPYVSFQSYNVAHQGQSFGKPLGLATGGDIYEPQSQPLAGNYGAPWFVAPGAQTTNQELLATTTPKPFLGQLFKAHLPELREVLELADPSVRIYSNKAVTKQGPSNAARTVISFRLARKIVVPLETSKVMQPEFYIQDGIVSYPSGVLSASSTTIAKPVGQDSEPSKNKMKAPQTDDIVKSQDESQEEPIRPPHDELEDLLAKKPLEVEAEIDSDDEKSNDDDTDYEDEVEHKEGKQSPDSLEVRLDELDQLDKTVAKKRPVVENRDKIVNDFGKDKLDKVGNFLSFGEKHALKLSKKVGLEHKSPDEAEELLEPVTSEAKHKQKILGDDQKLLDALLPTTEGHGSEDDREINEDELPAPVARSLRSLNSAQDWPYGRRARRSRLEVAGTRGYMVGLARS